ncbi:hypothetical protein GCM10009827_094350 [Dactylosporangium maewongense]|uniref:Uncharacterized protein n=1 Tax=Dactylosporangium maewongense TaxID=634393 RepID=A0ABN2CH62_9ACTN
MAADQTTNAGWVWCRPEARPAVMRRSAVPAAIATPNSETSRAVSGDAENQKSFFGSDVETARCRAKDG